jgi:cell division protein FtsI/penicillin-binding protein 2
MISLLGHKRKFRTSGDTGQQSRTAGKRRRRRVCDGKLLFLGAIMLIGFLVLTIRLWFVQDQLPDYYWSKIRISSEVTVCVPSVRGEIEDRNGVPLATNHSSYEVELMNGDETQHSH